MAQDDWLGLESASTGDDWLGLDQAVAEPEPGGPGLTWEDRGRAVMAGGAAVGQGAGWLAERGGSALGLKGLQDAGKALETVSRDAADTWRSGMSDYAGEVGGQKFLEDDPDSWTGFKRGDAGWDKVQMMLSESLLGTAAGMGAGAGITAGLKALPGVSRGVAATLGYSSGEAMVAAPAAGAQAEEEVRAMSPEDLGGHVEYQALLLDGVDPEVAKETLARAAGGQAAATTAVSTALLSSPFGRYLDAIVGGRAGSLPASIAKGGATEAAQETLQSGAEQLSVNAALAMNADPNRKLMQDVPEAMVGGAAAGAAMGGVFGAAGATGRDPGEEGVDANADLAAMRQRDLDQEAAAAAEAVRAQGGDALDGLLAEQQVYMDGEAVGAANFTPDQFEQIPTTPADGAVNFNPFQQGMDQPVSIDPATGQPVTPLNNQMDDFPPYAAPEVASQELSLAPLDQPAAGNEIEFQRDVTAEKAAPIEAMIQQRESLPQEADVQQADPEASTEAAPEAVPAQQQAAPPVVTKSGEPFKTEAAAKLARGRADLKGRTMTPVQVGGGWALQDLAIETDQDRSTQEPMESAQEAADQPDATQAPLELVPVEALDAAANEAATSPLNELPEPTEAQKEAGNYKVGRARVQGLDISIENPKGSTRSGKRPDGSTWSNTMGSHYGYIRKSTGADGEHVDAYIGPESEAETVYVVDQVNADGSFDEHKAMISYPDQATAEQAYLENYDEGWTLGPVTAMPVEEFRSWLQEGDTTAPLKPEAIRVSETAVEPDIAAAPMSETPAQPDIEAPQPTEARAEQSEQVGQADTPAPDSNVRTLRDAQEKKAAEKAAAKLKGITISETMLDESGNEVTVEQSADVALRQIDKRLQVLDSLLGCVSGST